jgi:hypothetical protein
MHTDVGHCLQPEEITQMGQPENKDSGDGKVERN